MTVGSGRSEGTMYFFTGAKRRGGQDKKGIKGEGRTRREGGKGRNEKRLNKPDSLLTLAFPRHITHKSYQTSS